MNTIFRILIWMTLLLPLAACTSPADPVQPNVPQPVVHDGSLRIAALDYYVDDLTDPTVLAKYTRAEILIMQPWQCWNNSLDLSPLRAANPDLRIIAYFSSKVVREEWRQEPGEEPRFTGDLYRAALPYMSRTTTGDTLRDWPGGFIFDFTDPDARSAMLAVFQQYQESSGTRFDGIFWDYFSPGLWISPAVEGMTGEPDMDQDGVPHWEDEDEMEVFLAGQDAWAEETRRMMGGGFIQIANGVRALRDSTFAARFDGMFYERFPDQGFYGNDPFRMALDPAEFNNLWAAHEWPRTVNGGPWLILSNMYRVGSYLDGDGEYQDVDADDFTRVAALLTGATAITYEGFAARDAGIPDVEYDLGPALGGVTIDGDTISRDFQNGSLEVTWEYGGYPIPFTFQVAQNGTVIHEPYEPRVE